MYGEIEGGDSEGREMGMGVYFFSALQRVVSFTPLNHFTGNRVQSGDRVGIGWRGGGSVW